MTPANALSNPETPATPTTPAVMAPLATSTETPAQPPVKAKAVRKTVAKKSVPSPTPSSPPTRAPAKAALQKATKTSVKVAADKVVKVKKPKLVRDSFTIPKAEYTVLEDLKQRAIELGNPAKKSELLRAGIKALAAMTDAAFKSTLKAVPTIKTGRPAKD